jgi:hypothetical protein
VKIVAASVSVLLVGLFAAQASAVTGTTSLKNNAPVATPMGPPPQVFVISDGGTLSLDSTVTAFIGISMTLTVGTGTPSACYTNLPNGPPTFGGAAVAWTGQSSQPIAAGANYTLNITMAYMDANMKEQTIVLSPTGTAK